MRLYASGIFNFRNSVNLTVDNVGNQMFRMDGSNVSNTFTFYNYWQIPIFTINELTQLVSSVYNINALTFNSTSDYRIKHDVQKISLYTTVDNLNPVTYKNALTGKQDMGFIAHELQEHFPFLVSGEKDGPTNQTVNYIGLIALLTKEIQELKDRIIILEERYATNYQTR